MKDKAQSIWRNAMKSTVPLTVIHVFLPLIFLWEIAHGDAYPFSKEDMDTLLVIQTVHLPSGKPVYKGPAIRVFAEQRNIEDVDLALGIVAFAKKAESIGETNLAGRALGHLMHLNETNSLPYLQEFVMAADHAGNRSSAIFAWLSKDYKTCLETVFSLITGNRMPDEERRSLFLGLWHHCHSLSSDDDIQLSAILRFLEDWKMLEKNDGCRSFIDSIFVDNIAGWKYSEKRLRLLQYWSKNQSETDLEVDWSRPIAEIVKAQKSGNTDWPLYKQRTSKPGLVKWNIDGEED